MDEARAREINRDMSECLMSQWKSDFKKALGCNYPFTDDEFHMALCLAQRAVLAGLTVGMHPDTLKEFEKASEKCRASHEDQLGFKIKKQVKEQV